MTSIPNAVPAQRGIAKAAYGKARQARKPALDAGTRDYGENCQAREREGQGKVRPETGCARSDTPSIQLDTAGSRPRLETKEGWAQRGAERGELPVNQEWRPEDFYSRRAPRLHSFW